MKSILNGQQTHWEEVFAENPDLYGTEPSYPAQRAFALIRKEKRFAPPAGTGQAEPSSIRVLELGAGQGRDALFFAGEGFQVYALDYSETGLKDIRQKAGRAGVERNLVFICHDVRRSLPFPDETFDICYSHMLYCMALTTAELRSLHSEVERVLKSGGLHVYTVRSTEDPHYGKGIPRGEDLYEMDGFIVHFFSREKIAMLSGGFDVLHVESFEEGDLPRKLFLVAMRKRV